MQNINKIKSNFVYSFGIIALWTVIVLIIFSPRPNIIDNNTNNIVIIDNRFVMFLLTRYFGLWSGIVVFLLRLLRIIKNKYFFIYIFISLLNISLGTVGIFFSVFKQINIELLCMFTFNLVIGLVMFIDIFSNVILNKFYNKQYG